MQLFTPKSQLIASLVLAGLGLIIFFSGDFKLLGQSLNLGFIGPWLFVVGAWFFADAVYSVPRSEEEATIAPGEWQAWIETAFVAAIIWQLWQAMPLYLPPLPISQNPDANAISRGIAPTLIAWAILSSILNSRWRNATVRDERDDAIDKRASSVGYTATVIGIIAVAIWLGFSPTERLASFSHAWLAQLLMIVVVVGAWLRTLSAALQYWWQRRSLPA